MFLTKGKLDLCLDRTEWDFGKPAGAARAVGVEKQSLVRNACLAERADDFGHAFLDLEQVAVVARHGLGAGQRDALAVGQKEHIRCLAFLSSLVGNLLAAPPGGCVAAVQLHAGHVQLGLVDLQQRLPHALLESSLNHLL